MIPSLTGSIHRRETINVMKTHQIVGSLSPKDLVRDVQIEHQPTLVLRHCGHVAGPDLQLVLRHHVSQGRIVEILVHFHHLEPDRKERRVQT